MQITDTLPYVSVMEEIKRRIFVINHCLGNSTELLGPPRVELAALQLRMVLELICLGSIAANRELFEQNSMKFEKHWHPGEIIRDMERLNPRFFPVPFKAGEPDTRGVITHNEIPDAYLLKDELVRTHGQLGNILHARNPFGKQIDHDHWAGYIEETTNKVVALLNCHEIRLLGDDHMYVVNMTEEGRDAVFMYEFERVDA
jgi:hypothetical protein